MTAQSIVFFFSCFVGAALGIYYDVFRIWRIAFNSRYLSVFIQDVLYCLSASVVVMLFVYYANSGVIRWYCMLGCLLSFLFYHFTVGKLVILISSAIISVIKKILGFVFAVTIKPVKKLLIIIASIIFGIIRSAAGIVKKSAIRLWPHICGFGGMFKERAAELAKRDDDMDMANKTPRAGKKKPAKKDVKKNIFKSRNFFVTVMIFVFITVSVVMLIRNIARINNNNANIAALEEQYDRQRIKNEELQQKLDAPIDDEYIKRIAEEELGYSDPAQILFYNNIK